MVPVAPGKRLGPDTEVRVGQKLWFPVLLDVVVVLLFSPVAVVGGGETQWERGEQGYVAPGVGQADGVVLLRFYILDVCARGASPRSLDTAQTDSNERRHFLQRFLEFKVHP